MNVIGKKKLFFNAQISLRSISVLFIPVIVFATILIVFSNCKDSDSDARLQLLIDADTANEVDDLYAIVRALIEPSIDVVGITSAQFHTSPLASDTTVLESQKINEDIVSLLSMEELPLPIGSNTPLKSYNTPASSDASRFIINEAHKMRGNQVLHIAVLGPCTNIASAILEDPSIIPKIKVHYIGFWHDVQTNEYDKNEFNSGNDTIAVEVLLNNVDLDFNVMTATTCQHLVFSKNDVDQHLKGKSGIAEYLIERWENYDRWWTTEDPEKKSWIMWDLAIIEALINNEMTTLQSFLTPPENTQREIGIYTDISVPEMIQDYWIHLDDYLEIDAR